MNLKIPLLLACLLPLSACHFYFSDGPEECDDWGVRPQPDQTGAALGLRNPETGVCEYNDNYVPDCDACGNCTRLDGQQTEPAPFPNWGACESECTGLEENSCLADSRCQGVYDSTMPGQFVGCWETIVGGAPPSVACETLDAYQCSLNNNCVRIHSSDCDDFNPDGSPGDCVPGSFLACADEPAQGLGCYGNSDCLDGSHCNAANICLPPPGGECEDGACDAPAVCYGYCILDDSTTQCDGVVLCESLPPLCEAGYTQGIANGCWTGECIPLELCPQTACEDIVSEYMCIAKEECSPLYSRGDNDFCECSPDGDCDAECPYYNYHSCKSQP